MRVRENPINVHSTGGASQSRGGPGRSSPTPEEQKSRAANPDGSYPSIIPRRRSDSASTTSTAYSHASSQSNTPTLRPETPPHSYQHGGTRSSAGEKAPAHLDGGHMNSGYSYKEHQRLGKVDDARISGNPAEMSRQQNKFDKLEAKISGHKDRIANADETITRLNKKPIWSPSDLKEMKQAKQERREAKADLSVAQNGNTFGNAFSRLSNWMRRRPPEVD